MGIKREKAMELFKEGYNCAQAVFLAYAEDYGMDETQAKKIASSFGGGMGRMREVCGAVSGMFMVAGLENGQTDPKDGQSKVNNYETVQKLAEKFKEENGSIYCRELLGLTDTVHNNPNPETRTEEYYKKRPCGELVGIACDIIDEVLGK
ncbi:MAG: C_GCAxxG_C_C family protein [Clostridia bacterium]|nr:C_GCAxxG_C_C family protein [Clostridia bacterium]